MPGENVTSFFCHCHNICITISFDHENSELVYHLFLKSSQMRNKMQKQAHKQNINIINKDRNGNNMDIDIQRGVCVGI